MLANRLKVLFTERKLQIKHVVANTSISRNTLSNLINKPTGNISVKTVNELCVYLKITPNEFFEYLPFDVYCDTNVTKNKTYFSDITRSKLTIKKNDINFDFCIYLKDSNQHTKKFFYSGSISDNKISWGDFLNIEIIPDESYSFKNIWSNKITPIFRQIIWEDFKENIAVALSKSMDERFNKCDLQPLNFELETNFLDLKSDFYTDQTFVNQ